MAWADNYIKKLLAGETIQFRPRGGSMSPLIKSGQLVTVEPYICKWARLQEGDIVLCKVNGRQYLHLIKAVRIKLGSGCIYQIGNNRGGINGWTQDKNIFGRVIRVE